MTNVDVRDNPAHHQFEAVVDGQLAVAAYRIKGDTITFTHTEVPQSLRGQGVGEALARAALDSARARGLRVVPHCPYIRSFIRRHPDYADLVAPD